MAGTEDVLRRLERDMYRVMRIMADWILEDGDTYGINDFPEMSGWFWQEYREQKKSQKKEKAVS